MGAFGFVCQVTFMTDVQRNVGLLTTDIKTIMDSFITLVES